jgi:hypothetical protein
MTAAGRFVSKWAAHPLLDRDGVWWAIYPFDWCPACGRETPHAGPYCQVNNCGVPNDGNPA